MDHFAVVGTEKRDVKEEGGSAIVYTTGEPRREAKRGLSTD